MKVRPMRPEDAVGVQDAHTAAVREVCAPLLEPAVVEAWLRGRTPDGYLRAADEGDERFWVAVDHEGGVMGFASWRDGELLALYVDPGNQGLGIGRRLFAACEEEARGQGLKITRLNSSLNARTFYEARGFRAAREGYREKHGQRIPHLEMERNGPGQPALTAPEN